MDSSFLTRVKSQESRVKSQESRVKSQESRVKSQESRVNLIDPQIFVGAQGLAPQKRGLFRDCNKSKLNANY
ncbi:MAG: hypothetical protein ACFKPT_28515 [Gloeotrichia echinulata GP01]